MKFLLIACLLPTAICLLNCGGPAERIKERAAATPAPTATPGEREISGNFIVSGAAANEMDPYTGSLSVAPKGDNYEFRWSTTKGTRIGTGVQLGTSTAATYAPTGGGNGCGVVLYRIASDGSLESRSSLWGEEKFGIEKATRTEGTGFVGKYTVTGVRSDGQEYSGSLTISKDGAGYDLEWLYDGAAAGMPKGLVAFAIWKGSYAAASFGGRQCSFALYDIQSNGSLEGNWGGQKEVTFGTENAKRQ